MKIHEFGLWFWSDDNAEWSKTIPPDSFAIYYDGECLGRQWPDYELSIFGDIPHIMKLKMKLDVKKGCTYTYQFHRLLTMDDFDIVENPDYRGEK